MNYRCTYAALVGAGHAPVKALEITIDAMRGNRYALQWIHIVKRETVWMRLRLHESRSTALPASPIAPGRRPIFREGSDHAARSP